MDSKTLIIVFMVILLAFVSSAKESRILLLHVDNRELNDDIQSPKLEYFSLTSAINYAYATRHGYDFLIFNVNNTKVAAEVAAKYSISSTSAMENMNDILNVKKMSWASQSKMELSVFHNKHKYFRATPWAKIALLWNLAIIVKEKMETLINYDYVFYVDSDFVINPNFHSRSLDDAFTGWSQSFSRVRDTAFIFFSNAPYSQRPCTGGIVLNMKHALAAKLIQAWWDVDIPYNNFAHEYEQAALWKMLDENHEIKHNNIYLHGERQFPPW